MSNILNVCSESDVDMRPIPDRLPTPATRARACAVSTNPRVGNGHVAGRPPSQRIRNTCTTGYVNAAQLAQLAHAPNSS
jgi:hypothetical protein